MRACALGAARLRVGVVYSKWRRPVRLVGEVKRVVS